MPRLPIVHTREPANRVSDAPITHTLGPYSRCVAPIPWLREPLGLRHARAARGALVQCHAEICFFQDAASSCDLPQTPLHSHAYAASFAFLRHLIEIVSSNIVAAVTEVFRDDTAPANNR